MIDLSGNRITWYPIVCGMIILTTKKRSYHLLIDRKLILLAGLALLSIPAMAQNAPHNAVPSTNPAAARNGLVSPRRSSR